MRQESSTSVRTPLDEYVTKARGKCYVVPVAKACNAACKFCATEEYKPDVERELIDLGLMPEAITNLWEAGVRRIEVTGGGEPTLHPKIEGILATLHNSPEVYIKLYTNGSRLPDGSNVDELNISRSSLDLERNQRIMRLKQGTPGLPDLVRHARSLGYRNIRISVPLVRGGVDSLGEAARFLDSVSRYVDGVVFRPLYPATPSRHLLNINISDIESWERVLNSLDSVRAGECRVEVDTQGCFRASQLILASDCRLYSDWSLANRVSW